MSRCFPFPPPGYEKEAGTDDIGLLEKDIVIQEKHREKKHKKEKKEKKRDGKEKKDKDRDGKEKKDKDREGKEKKDKDREGKEKKEKERSKDKHRDKKERKERRKEKKKDKSKEKDKSKVSDENKNEGQLQVTNGGKPGDNMQRDVHIKDSKFVEELGRRIGAEGCSSANQMVENFTNCDNRKAEGLVRVAEKDINNRVKGRENKDQKGDYEKMDTKQNRDEERVGGGNVVQNSTVLDQRRVGGVVRQAEEKNVGKRIEGNEKNKELGIDNKQRNGHKEGDREKKSKEDKGKEKGKMTMIVENDKKHDIVREGGRGLVATLNSKPLHVPKDVDRNSAAEENLKKRKEHEANGFLYGNDGRANKLPRPAISQPLMENGRMLEPCRAPVQHASSLHGGANNLKVDKKGHKINGLIDAQQPSAAIKASSSSATASKVSDNGVAITRPSHPDSKILSQILSVPKMEEWSEFDDQEWLFTSYSHRSEKHKQPLFSSVDGTQVWDKVLQIQSDDVCALPYVIPY